jgi:signal transduction histidine kinase/ligand-binding sensor domain-containing protein/DNA-binding response OmpR family regulator
MVSSHHIRVTTFFPGILSAFLVNAVPAQPQGVTFEHLSGTQGLVGKEVHCILQDSRGYMWFGTEQGLNRYDGYAFTVFKHEAGNATSIVAAKVQSLLEDRQGTLWVGTWHGLEKFDRATNTFTHFLPDLSPSSDPWSNVIYDMCEDKNGTMWVSGKGLRRFDRSTGAFTRMPHDDSTTHPLIQNSVDAVFEDRSGNLWVGAGGALEQFDRSTGKYAQYWVDEKIKTTGSPARGGFHWIQRIYEDRRGILWLCTDGGPVAFNRSTGEFKPYHIFPESPDSSAPRSISSIIEDDSGVLVIGSWGGGYMTYDARADSFIAQPLDPEVVPDGSVSALYRDRGGIIWIGTNGNGILKVVKADKRFTGFVRDDAEFPRIVNYIPPVTRSLQNNDIHFIDQDKSGIISIGTATGSDGFDRRAGTFAHWASWDWPYDITGIVHSRFGPVTWTGVGGDGVNKIQEKPYRRKYFGTQQEGLGGSACSLFEDRRGILWMLISDAGLCQFDPHTERFKNLGIGQSQPFVAARMIVEDSVDSSDKGWALWIGTNDGLWKYDARRDAFTRFGHDPKDPRSLSSNTVTMVFRDRAGTLWIGTDHGLNRMDAAAQTFECLTMDNGLPDNDALGILEDGQGRQWVSTTNAISKYDSRTKRFTSYSMKSVVPGIRFGAGCCLRTDKGEMLFGGNGGFVLFHPDSIRDNSHVPPVVITGFRKFDLQAVLDSAVSETKAFTLSYQDNFFSFEFAALDFTDPDMNQYGYMLEGYDTSWTYSGERQYARYVNVGPGHYIFRVKCSNNDGVWNEEGSSVAVIIAPPFWRTWWAYTFYVVLAVGLLYVLRRYELNRQALKFSYELGMVESAKLREVNTVKSRFFANISHEFRTPLTLILGPVRELHAVQPDEKSKEKLSMIERSAQRLLQLINQLLDLSKLEAGGMKLQAAPGNIVPFVRGIAQAFQSSAGRRSLTLSVEESEEAIELYFDRDKMEKILTNVLSNAFKFTPAGGKVTVAVSQDTPGTGVRGMSSGFVCISVSDTGIGIPPEELSHIFDRFYQVDASQTREHEGSGIGLALAKELVELHHGTISVKSEVGKGTTLALRFPAGRAHLSPDEIAAAPQVEEDPVIPDHDAADLPMAESSEAASHSPDESLPLILIIEDNADVRTYIRDYLVPDYRVDEAGDGNDGIRKAKDVIPDLIISDVMMPKIDGYEVCKRVKQDEKRSHIPVILLTARAGQENKLEGLETGADDYLTKPFDAKELVVRIRNLIEIRRKLRERFSKTQVLKPGEIAVTSIDDRFLQKVMAVVEQKMGNEKFSVEELAGNVGMSRSQLHRKLSALTGQSPTNFIRYMRLHRAMDSLQKDAGTVSEIAYAVGFSGVSYFTKCFREQFGTLPSEVKK